MDKYKIVEGLRAILNRFYELNLEHTAVCMELNELTQDLFNEIAKDKLEKLKTGIAKEEINDKE